jgi:ABC-type cobalamin transport system permease subunit
MKKLWFRRKRYGWGWYPVTWQGWAVTLAFAGAIAFMGLVYSELFKFAAYDTRGLTILTLIFLAIEMALAGILIAICYATGEPPRWQWGKDE